MTIICKLHASIICMDDQLSDSPPSMECPTSGAATPTNILSLPDDCLFECFCHLSVINLPSVALVCSDFSHILRHCPQLASLRKQVCREDLTHATTLLSVSSDLTVVSAVHYIFPYSFSLSTSIHVSSFRLPPVVDATTKLSHASTVVIDSNIYIIGFGFTLCIEPLCGTIKTCAPTIVARRKFVAVNYKGKIYVAGGACMSRSVEEYDPSTDKWQVVANAPVDLSQCFLGLYVDGHLILYIHGGIPSAFLVYSFETKHWSKTKLRGIRELCPSAFAHAVGVCKSGGFIYLLMQSGENIWFVGPPPTQSWCELFEEYKWTTETCRENSLVRINCVSVGSEKLGVMIETSSQSETEVIFLEFDLSKSKSRWTRVSELVSPFNGTAFTGICSTSDNPTSYGVSVYDHYDQYM